MGHTTADLRLVQQKMADRFDGQPFWSAEEARLYFNEALLEWNLFTATWRKRITAVTLANRHILDIPGGMLTYVTTVRYLDRRPLHRSSRIALEDLRPRWRGEFTDQGGDVPLEPKHWFPYGLTKFGIWPGDHRSNRLLLLDGVAVTPQLSNTTDSVDISDSELSLLIGEAIHIATFKLGAARMAQAAKFHQQFIAGALDKNDRLKASVRMRQAAGLDTSHMERPARQFPRAADKLQGAFGGNQ